MTATTPGTASNSESRKRLAEQAAATCPTVTHVGEHSKHWDPAVVQLIEQARAEGAAEVVARMEALAEKWEREAEPYLPGGAWYDKAHDTLIARADCRELDAIALRAALRGPR